MEVVCRKTFIAFLKILAFCAYANAIPGREEDESVEFVLIDKKNGYQGINTGPEGNTGKAEGSKQDAIKARNRSKVLRNLLNTLAIRLLASEKFRSEFMSEMKNKESSTVSSTGLRNEDRPEADSGSQKPSDNVSDDVSSASDSSFVAKGLKSKTEPDMNLKQEALKIEADAEASTKPKKQHSDVQGRDRRGILGSSSLLPQSDVVKAEDDNPSKSEQSVQADVSKPDIATLNKLERIPMGYEVFCALVQNLDFVRDKLKGRPNIGRIGNILVYSNHNITDYWGRLKFKKEGEKYVDETGYFEGIRVNSFEDLLHQGKMTETGFMQKKDIGSNEINENIITMKLLLNEIAKEKNITVFRVIDEKCNMSVLEELIFYGNSPSAHNNETVNICICTDSFCKDPCKEILPMKRGDIKFRS